MINIHRYPLLQKNSHWFVRHPLMIQKGIRNHMKPWPPFAAPINSPVPAKHGEFQWKLGSDSILKIWRRGQQTHWFHRQRWGFGLRQWRLGWNYKRSGFDHWNRRYEQTIVMKIVLISQSMFHFFGWYFADKKRGYVSQMDGWESFLHPILWGIQSLKPSSHPPFQRSSSFRFHHNPIQC